MARNERRRRALLDAAIRVLANWGARGLTHRAVDTEAGVPKGTTSNYFKSRETIIGQLCGRISERLRPDPTVHAELGKRRASIALYAAYVQDIVARLTAERDVTLALFELRLEATRHPEVAVQLQQWLSAGFTEDVSFVRSAGLPGGAREVALFHYAIDGLVLDRLTVSIDQATATDDVVKELAGALLTPSSKGKPARAGKR